MSPPLDLQNDPSPLTVLESVPNRAALERVIRETDGVSVPDPQLELDDFLADYNPIEVRRLVAEIKFAHQNHIYYYRVPGLERVSFDEGRRDPKQTTSSMVGAEITWVTHEHDRTYIGCSVPEETGQLQLGWVDEVRETVICVVNPDSGLLELRAGDSGAAADAHRAVCDDAGINHGESLPSRIFEEGFNTQAIEIYRNVEFASTDVTSPITDLAITTDYSEGVNHGLFEDDVVETLLSRRDIELDNSRVDLSILGGETVTVSYTGSSIELHRFVPESWLLTLSDAIAAAMR